MGRRLDARERDGADAKVRNSNPAARDLRTAIVETNRTNRETEDLMKRPDTDPKLPLLAPRPPPARRAGHGRYRRRHTPLLSSAVRAQELLASTAAGSGISFGYIEQTREIVHAAPCHRAPAPGASRAMSTAPRLPILR
jgi:hypothetical protein